MLHLLQIIQLQQIGSFENKMRERINELGVKDKPWLVEYTPFFLHSIESHVVRDQMYTKVFA